MLGGILSSIRSILRAERTPGMVAVSKGTGKELGLYPENGLEFNSGSNPFLLKQILGVWGQSPQLKDTYPYILSNNNIRESIIDLSTYPIKEPETLCVDYPLTTVIIPVYTRSSSTLHKNGKQND
jgi:hypothetical protein